MKLGLINPGGSFRLTWDAVTMFLVVFVACRVPYQVGFTEVEGDVEDWVTEPMWWIDRVVDWFFAVDIVLVFFTAIKEDTGRYMAWITKRSQLARRYLGFWFCE